MRPILTITAIAIFCTTACTPKPGNVKGNTYWFYNKFVGNKPDAGAKVKLYGSNRKDSFTTVVDMRGDFYFEKIPSGEYLMIVISNNTTASPEEVAQTLQNNNTILKQYFDLQKDVISNELYEQALSVEKRKENIIPSEYHYYAAYSNARQGMQNEELRLRAEIVDSALAVVGHKLGAFSEKVKIQEIKVEPEKTTNVVVDFGITYL